MRLAPALFLIIFLLAVNSLFAARARAADGPKDCVLEVGLLDHLKPFSRVNTPTFGECQASCRSTMSHWDNENYSTRCKWDGKVFAENKIGLMDINWAACLVNATQIRVSHRECVRACSDHLKRLPKGVSPESVRCEWDGHRVSLVDLERSRGLFP